MLFSKRFSQTGALLDSTWDSSLLSRSGLFIAGFPRYKTARMHRTDVFTPCSLLIISKAITARAARTDWQLSLDFDYWLDLFWPSTTNHALIREHLFRHFEPFMNLLFQHINFKEFQFLSCLPFHL